MPSGLFYLNSLDWSISNRKDVRLVLLLLFVTDIPVCYANSVDLDQTPRSTASDLSLHFLPMSLLRNARVKLMNLVEILSFLVLWLRAFTFYVGVLML